MSPLAKPSPCDPFAAKCARSAGGETIGAIERMIGTLLALVIVRSLFAIVLP
jgi:hypothetical protein